MNLGFWVGVVLPLGSVLLSIIKNGQPRAPEKYDVKSSVINLLLTVGLFYWAAVGGAIF